MATKIISHTWNLPLPNDFLVDHSFSDNKSRTAVYDGPDKLYLQLGADGKEKYGPLTEDDIADGRPRPADVVEWFEVDCAANDTNTLICQLRGPVIDEKEEERGTGEVVHAGSPDLGTDYPRLSYATPLMTDDIYNYESIKKNASNQLEITAFSVREKINGADVDLTWDNIRGMRNRNLESSDGSVATDMPTSMSDEWKAYRTKLRDFPKKMLDAGVHPNIAQSMFPQEPFNTPPPRDPEANADGSSPWAPPGGVG
jgi:hypothetical protein